MALPKHIQKELDDAEADFKAAYPDRAPAVADDKTIAAGEQVQTGNNDNETIANPSGETAAPHAGNTENTPDYKQKYKVLKGKYDSEVSALRSQVTELPGLRTEVAGMQEQIDQLKAQPNSETPKPVASSATLDELREEYGDDFADSIIQVVKSQVESELGEITERVETVEVNKANNEGFSELDRIRPGWRDTDKDPLFHEWLSVSDGFSDETRQQLLSAAFQAGNFDRVAFFVDAYEAEAKTQSQTTNDTEVTNQNQTQQRRQLPSSTTGEGAGVGKRAWSNPEITAFYKDLSLGKYKGRESEGIAIERDIFAAGNEGRITT